MTKKTDLGAIKDVVSGAVWKAFCAHLAETGDIVLAVDVPDSALDRAEGFRYLTRLLRVALEMNLEHADPDFPTFYKASHETAKIGADNPDNIYWNTTVSGANDYRITAVRGTVSYFSIGTKANRYHLDGTMTSTGELEDRDIQWGPNGEADIVVSATPKPGNWLKMAADTSFVIIRQSYLDRTHETPGRFRIERIGGPAVPPPLNAPLFEQALMRSAAFVRGTATTFADWTRMFRQHRNEMPVIDQAIYQKAGGDPHIYYYHGYFDLQPDEAWVIEARPPECPYWNFQLDNWWMESLDYRFRKITVNKHTARYNADDSVTLVVAARDPGMGNWIDTAGHACGTALLRWVKAKDHPQPRCRVVKLTDLCPR
ncbi:MAG TPA: DUF1214 domain-containing protein [Acidocella sp.]|nr:DUF1214 domain-containing protein [Acidocella sp.]